MDDDLRQSSGSTSSNSAGMATTGTGTTQSAEVVCGYPEPGPETIQVEQVVGAEMAQRVVEFDMEVPAPKPDIEQVVDVYIKDVEINNVNVIPDKVIVRGDLTVKVMYVADLPNQPVHAFEKSQIRFTRDIQIEGAQRGMDATAEVNIEYVDFDFDETNNRVVHVTIVLKFWARVISTTEMDVYALGPVTEVGEVEVTSANEAANAEYGGESVNITGPGVAPSTGMQPSAGGTGTVQGNSVNVRTGPGTNFPVVTKVNTGDTVDIKDQAFGWYKVVLPDGATTGWIASWLVDTGGTVPAAPQG